MRQELADAGHDVYVVAINAPSAAANQGALTDKCSFPLLQDTEEVDAWGQLGGSKDDFFVLDENGDVVAHLPVGGEVSTNLSTEEGYANVRAALLAAEPLP
ncbi:MAG: hypothetical protein EP329_08360 [Deltaproteobacteria bacterium]|nr:MAG: hypothetical protein EP329_08360 [Deltaproteobacteria bacterium]